MTEPVRRGGRIDPALAAKEADEAAEARRVKEVRLSDVRALLVRPEFRRFVTYWVGQSGAFAIAKIFTAESYWLGGRRELGMEMWNDLVAADPQRVVEMLEITTDTKE